MANQYSPYVTITPCVLRAEEKPQVVRIHAKEAYAQKLLDGVGRVRVISVDGPTIKWRKWRSFGEWPRDTPPAEFRRTENGDLAVTVTAPVEGEYTIRLDVADATGEFVEKAVFFVYALADDLYRLTPYKGDFHMHSTASDGTHSPEYVRRVAARPASTSWRIRTGGIRRACRRRRSACPACVRRGIRTP